MPAINQITGIINAAFISGHFGSRRFQPSKFSQVADVIKVRNEGDNEYSIPTIIDNTGEGTELTYNDQYSCQCFHRLLKPSYPRADPDYGVPGSTMEETTEMKLVFMADRAQVLQRPEDIMAAVVYDFPKELTPTQIASLNITSCIIELGDIEHNPYDVFFAEWGGRDYDLTTSSILFALNYKIITTYNSCFAICP
jgi:hypothetical protein